VNIEVWFVYVGTVLVLMSTPGPSQLLILSNSISNGIKRSLYTAAGDLSANFLQMIIASVGLVSIISNSQEFFIGIKWGGVLYLIYLGLKLIFTKNQVKIENEKQARTSHSLYWQGFITSAANPKAVIFFAALFPQFLNPEGDLLFQFGILSSTYLILDAIFLCFYGKFAEWVSNNLMSYARTHLNKISGGFLIFAAILLGLKEVEATPKLGL
jgi:homoserine/homoserine lactone efflux protein